MAHVLVFNEHAQVTQAGIALRMVLVGLGTVFNSYRG